MMLLRKEVIFIFIRRIKFHPNYSNGARLEFLIDNREGFFGDAQVKVDVSQGLGFCFTSLSSGVPGISLSYIYEKEFNLYDKETDTMRIPLEVTYKVWHCEEVKIPKIIVEAAPDPIEGDEKVETLPESSSSFLKPPSNNSEFEIISENELKYGTSNAWLDDQAESSSIIVERANSIWFGEESNRCEFMVDGSNNSSFSDKSTNDKASSSFVVNALIETIEQLDFPLHNVINDIENFLPANNFIEKTSAEVNQRYRKINQRNFERAYESSHLFTKVQQNPKCDTEQATSGEDQHLISNVKNVSSNNIFNRDEPQSKPEDSHVKSDSPSVDVCSPCWSPGLKFEVPYKPENIIYVGDLERIIFNFPFKFGRK